MTKTMTTKVLEILAEANESLDIQAIGEGTGSRVKSIGEALRRLNKEQLVENPGKRFWQIKDKGREEFNKINEQEARSKKPAATSKKPEQEPPGPLGETETVPSQSDLFRSIGEKFRGAPPGQFHRLL